MAENSLKVDFTGKRAVVTGAGRGLGREITKTLVGCGALVVALDKIQENLDKLKSNFSSVKTTCVDLTDWEATRRAVIEAGPIDLLVNNAGYLVYKPILETTKEEVDDMLGVNVRAMINISQVVGAGMIERGEGGAIVNLSSVASHRYATKAGIYCATKSGVDMLTRGLAREFGRYNIRVNSVNPGLMLTDMGNIVANDRYEDYVKHNSLQRVVEKDDVVKMVLFLLSDHGNSITGSNILTDAGNFA